MSCEPCCAHANATKAFITTKNYKIKPINSQSVTEMKHFNWCMGIGIFFVKTPNIWALTMVSFFILLQQKYLQIWTNTSHSFFWSLSAVRSDQTSLLQDAVPVSLRRTATKQQCEIQPLPHATPGTQFMGLALGDNQSSSFPLPHENSLLWDLEVSCLKGQPPFPHDGCTARCWWQWPSSGFVMALAGTGEAK